MPPKSKADGKEYGKKWGLTIQAVGGLCAKNEHSEHVQEKWVINQSRREKMGSELFEAGPGSLGAWARLLSPAVRSHPASVSSSVKGDRISNSFTKL